MVRTYVIKINFKHGNTSFYGPQRYFCGVGKKGQILTAWSLAGAKLFGNYDVLQEVERRLIAKGKEIERWVVFDRKADTKEDVEDLPTFPLGDVERLDGVPF